MGVPCILCDKEAEHQLSYSSLRDEINWIGNYCIDCFVIKLRVMAVVWNKRNTKQCNNCGTNLSDKRSKVCDVCKGIVFSMKGSQSIDNVREP